MGRCERGCRTRCVGWIETYRSRVAACQGFARIAVLIIDLDVLYFGELFEIQRDQVSNVEALAFGHAGTFKINVRDTVLHLQSAIACEAVIDTDPTEGSSFGCAGTFEVFIERGLQQNI